MRVSVEEKRDRERERKTTYNLSSPTTRSSELHTFTFLCAAISLFSNRSLPSFSPYLFCN
jgi:hypothetical protein